MHGAAGPSLLESEQEWTDKLKPDEPFDLHIALLALYYFIDSVTFLTSEVAGMGVGRVSQ